MCVKGGSQGTRNKSLFLPFLTKGEPEKSLHLTAHLHGYGVTTKNTL